MKTILFFLLSLVSCSCLTQSLSKSDLEKMEDEELLSYFNEVRTDSVAAEMVARTYLNRGKAQKDTIKMARGYDRLARIFSPKKNIAFSDSVIGLTKNMNHITYPGLAYVIKGAEYNNLGHLVRSNENFYTAYRISKSNKNIAQQLYAMNILITNKSFWGDKYEALDMQREQLRIIQNDEFTSQLKNTTRKGSDYKAKHLRQENTMSAYVGFIICHVNLRDIESAKYYLDLGLALNNRYDGIFKESYKSWLLECENEINFYSGNYNKVISISDTLIKLNNLDKDYSQNFDPHLFKGLSLIETSNFSEGYKELLIADSLNMVHQIKFYPYRRVLYETLLGHYRSERDIENQIECLNKLISIDSVFKSNYWYFERDLTKNFETPRLLKEKEDLILGLRQKNEQSRFRIMGYLVLLSLVFILLIYYINRQRIYRNRYAHLIADQGKVSGVLSLHDKKERSIISPAVVEDILESLERFERKRQYLSMDINLHDLAKSFTTNPNYLSRVINLKMEKNFSQYISDLRLEYAIVALQEDKKMRKYSIKAIANDCGFKSSESFSRAFYKKNGIYPSYYLKKLNREVG